MLETRPKFFFSMIKYENNIWRFIKLWIGIDEILVYSMQGENSDFLVHVYKILTFIVVVHKHMGKVLLERSRIKRFLVTIWSHIPNE